MGRLKHLKHLLLAGIAATCVFTGGVVPRMAVAQAVAAVPAPVFDAAAKKEAVTTAAKMLADSYIYPDVGAKAAAMLTQNLAAGKYDGAATPAALAEQLTTDLQGLTHDKHLRVFVPGAPPPTAPAGPPPPNLFGFAEARRLKGNIGYVALNGFPPKEPFKWAADKVMPLVASTDALIIDLRNNGGGSPASVSYLVSVFFDGRTPVHVMDIVWRKSGTTDFDREVHSTEPTPISYLGKPVYLITSPRTFSGGEEFAYDMQTLKRATLVGETTGGGAHPGGGRPIGAGLGLWLPVGRSESPVTHGDWEGKGVQPDVPVTADQSFATTYAAALNAAGHPAPPATVTVQAVTDVQFLLPARTAQPDFAAELERRGYDKTEAVYQIFKAHDAGFTLFDDELVIWGYDLMAKGRLPAAIAVFKLDTQLHPDSWNAFDSLGEAYQNHGDKDLAIAAYRRSLELDPKNDNAVDHLKTLGA